eukprot:GHUV01036781.1.p1 GENE.GHUV01036781.1~~GHUV01036781.1.p1  ORF type:complete len:130 (-),score=31.33 GHUV01036781.1:584-973(-)
MTMYQLLDQDRLGHSSWGLLALCRLAARGVGASSADASMLYPNYQRALCDHLIHPYLLPHICSSYCPKDMHDFSLAAVCAVLPCSCCCSQAEARYRELTGMGLSVNLVLVGNKGKQYFGRRPQYNIASE